MGHFGPLFGPLFHGLHISGVQDKGASTKLQNMVQKVVLGVSGGPPKLTKFRKYVKFDTFFDQFLTHFLIKNGSKNGSKNGVHFWPHFWTTFWTLLDPYLCIFAYFSHASTTPNWPLSDHFWTKKWPKNDPKNGQKMGHFLGPFLGPFLAPKMAKKWVIFWVIFEKI